MKFGIYTYDELSKEFDDVAVGDTYAIAKKDKNIYTYCPEYDKQFIKCSHSYYAEILEGVLTAVIEEANKQQEAQQKALDREFAEFYSDANKKQIGGDHYKTAIEPWDYIIANDMGYLEGNCLKYLSRYKKKNGLQDLEKALHYLQKLIEVTKEKEQGGNK